MWVPQKKLCLDLFSNFFFITQFSDFLMMSYGNLKHILGVFSFQNLVFNSILVIKHKLRVSRLDFLLSPTYVIFFSFSFSFICLSRWVWDTPPYYSLPLLLLFFFSFLSFFRLVFGFGCKGFFLFSFFFLFHSFSLDFWAWVLFFFFLFFSFLFFSFLFTLSFGV